MVHGEKKKTGAVPVILSGKLNVESIPEIQDQLLKLFNLSDQTINIQFTEVEGVDYSFIQFLCSVHKSVHNQGKTIDLGKKVPQIISDSINSLGFCQGCSVFKSGAVLC